MGSYSVCVTTLDSGLGGEDVVLSFFISLWTLCPCVSKQVILYKKKSLTICAINLELASARSGELA